VSRFRQIGSRENFRSSSLSVSVRVQERRFMPAVTHEGCNVNNIIYLVGLVVVVAFIASFVLGHV
jgi:hypothetical protein